MQSSLLKAWKVLFPQMERHNDFGDQKGFSINNSNGTCFSYRCVRVMDN